MGQLMRKEWSMKVAFIFDGKNGRGRIRKKLLNNIKMGNGYMLFQH